MIFVAVLQLQSGALAYLVIRFLLNSSTICEFVFLAKICIFDIQRLYFLLHVNDLNDPVMRAPR